MKTIRKLLALVGFICLFQFGLAQTNDRKDILVLEYGNSGGVYNFKAYGMYIYWPDKEMEFIQIQIPSKLEDAIQAKKKLFGKLNELTDLGWDLITVDNSTGLISYYFEKEK